MKAENRHYTKVWKQKRKHKLADKCGNPKCTICHSDKVLNIPDRQLLRQQSKENDMSETFFSETTEVCNCRKCKHDFKAYNYWEDCPNCNDGETDEGLMCHACGGHGTLDSVVKDICQDCLYLELTKEDS